MKSALKKSLLSVVAALLCAGAASADVIDFEGLDTSNLPFAPQFAANDYLFQGKYFVQLIDPNNPDGGSMAGALINVSDANSCLDQVCPTGNGTTYIGSVDDAIVHFGLSSGGASTLGSFDAAFLAPTYVTLPSDGAAFLAIEGDRADGSHVIGAFQLNWPGADGLTSFSSFNAADAHMLEGTGTLSSGPFVDFFAYAYYCDASTCTAFGSNRGQFALDNISLNVSAVPEPSQYLLLALGLGVVGAVSVIKRRRNRV